MNVDHYLSVGFQNTGYLFKSDKVKKKYKVEVKWKEIFDPHNKMGVYILADDKNNILRLVKHKIYAIALDVMKVILDLQIE